MHFLRTSLLLVLSTCLAQVIASPSGRDGQGRGDNNNGVQAYGNERDGQGDAQANAQQGDGGPRAQNQNQDDECDENDQQDDEDCDENDQQNGQIQANGQGDGRGDAQGDGQNQNEGDKDNDNNGDRQGNRDGNDQGKVEVQISTVTMTVTSQIAAAAATGQALTVMTVTVTAPCVPPPAAAGAPNAASTSVIAAPKEGAGTVRKFVTQAADIKPGLTSLPVAVASALGADPSAVPGVFASGAASQLASGAAVPPGAAVANLGNSAFAGATFTTSGVVVVGKSSVPAASPIPSAR